MKRTYSAVVCTDSNRGIGRKGYGMLWNNKAEMHHFKNLTMYHPVVMGHRTWETLSKPLNNRQNIVLSRNKSFKLDNALVINEVEALETTPVIDDEVMVIGGLQVWKAYWKFIDTIYMSVLFESYSECDLFFPDVTKEFEPIKEESGIGFTFYTWKRKECLASN